MPSTHAQYRLDCRTQQVCGRRLQILPLLMLFALGLVAAGFAPRGGFECVAAAADAKASTVKLVVDYGDGVEVHYTALPFKPGMTVLDALTAAQAHKHGLTFKHRGSGTFAMLTKLNDVENEGGGTTAKNWLYQVNGKDADVSFGIKQLQSGDAILWKFAVLQYNQ